MTTRTKWCGMCQETHSAEAFYVDKKGALSAYCKVQQRIYAKARHASNPTYQVEQNRKNKSLHPQWFGKASRRARFLDVVNEPVDRRAIWGRDEGHCRVKLVCNGDFVPFEEMHLDHIIPLAKGGAHACYNVQTSCAPCNVSKGVRVLGLVF